MRIRRLQVHDLRRYRELDIDLAPGVTVIRGPNEAGKTTIQRAIELAITRRVTSAAADLDALRPWDAEDDARPWIAIEFEQDEEDGRKATGSLEKTFAGQRGTVQLEYDGQVVSDPALADQVMAELSGIPTEAFFRSTASIRHHELSDLARDETALRDRLQASISGADRGTGRARRSSRGPSTSSPRGARRTPAGSRSRRPPSPPRPRPSRPASRPWPSWSATATRSRPRAIVGPMPRLPWPSGEACSRRPARPSGSRPSGRPPRSATSAIATRSRWRPSWTASPRPTRRPTRSRS